MKLFNRSKTNRVPSLTVPSSRTLRIEFLEERALLSVGDAVIYGPVPWVEPADRPEFVSASELARSERTPLMMDDAAIYGPIPWVEPADRPELMSASELTLALKTPELLAPPSLDAVIDEETDSFLDELETSVSYSESDEVEALKPAFFVDGDAYYSLSEVMTKRVVFENQAPSTPTSDDVILVSEQSSSERNDDSSGLRSGGEGGESWYYELTSDSTHVDAGLSYVYQNALIEKRGFDVSGGESQSNSNYLKVTASAPPTGYYATIRFTGSATAGADYDVYFKYDNYWIYNAPGNISYSGGSTTFYIFPKNDFVKEDLETVTAEFLEFASLSSGGEDDPVSVSYGTTSISAWIVDDDQWDIEIETTDEEALEPCDAILTDAELSGCFVVSRVPTSDALFRQSLSPSSYEFDVSYAVTVELEVAEPTEGDDVTASVQDYEFRTTLTGSSCGATITIPADVTQQTVYVRALADSLYEKDEIVSISLDSAWAGNASHTFSCSNDAAEITIIQAPEFVSNNDETNPPTGTSGYDYYTGYVDRRVTGSAPLNVNPRIFAYVNDTREVRYAIISGNEDGYFSLDANTGVITLNEDFTEHIKDVGEATYWITIKAYDIDNPQLYDVAYVVVVPLSIGLRGDTDRNNIIDEDDENGKGTWTNSSGAIILYNGDDDDGDHVQDNLDTFINTGDRADVGELWLDKLGVNVSAIQSNLRIELTLESSPDEDSYWSAFQPQTRVRVFWPSIVSGSDYVCGINDSQLLGGDTTQTGGTISGRSSVVFVKTPNLTAGERDISVFLGTGKIKLGIEGLIPGAPTTVRVKYYLGATPFAEDHVALKVTPFIAFSHEARVETNRNDCGPTVFVSNLGIFNADLRGNLDDQYGSALSEVAESATGGDRWWQDPFEIGYVQAPYGSQYVILALPRSTKFYGSIESCAFRQYAKSSMIRNNVGLYEQFADVAFNDNHQNDGGNFEVMPGDNSKHNSLGIIIMGIGSSGTAMNSEIVDFLVAQGVQDVVSDVDLSWMSLGHIDEVISFATTSDGRARVASPDAAWALLVYAKKQGLGQQQVFPYYIINPVTYQLEFFYHKVDELLQMDKYREWNLNAEMGYSQKIQTNVIQRLGLISNDDLETATYSNIESHNGASNEILSKVGYLEGYDNIGEGGHIFWQLVFTDALNFEVFYRKEGTSYWTFDGNGCRGLDFISDSKICYILKNYWKSGTTPSGSYITFETHPSSKFIELPVLFRNSSGFYQRNNANSFSNALAYSNNVINSLVDGNRLFVADVPDLVSSGINIFNNYVKLAVRKVGFTNVNSCNETIYHDNNGSIHCGTNVLRVIPDDGFEWWNLF